MRPLFISYSGLYKYVSEFKEEARKVQMRKAAVSVKHVGLAESGQLAVAHRCKAGRQRHVGRVSAGLRAQKFLRNGSNNDQHSEEHQKSKCLKRLLTKHVVDAIEPAHRGLMLHPKYISEILSGNKTWEVRPYRLHSMPERIHLIPTGISKSKGVGIISGEVCVKDAIPILSSFIWTAEAQAKHRVSLSDSGNIISSYVKKKKPLWAWVLSLPTAYDPPRTFQRKVGQQAWVITDESRLGQPHRKRCSSHESSRATRQCKRRRK